MSSVLSIHHGLGLENPIGRIGLGLYKIDDTDRTAENGGSGRSGT